MNKITIVEAQVSKAISLLRDQYVLMDSDLAELYGVSTKRLNEQVKRNASRFPDDFMAQLTETEWKNLKSQFATSKGKQEKSAWRGRRTHIISKEETRYIVAFSRIYGFQSDPAEIYKKGQKIAARAFSQFGEKSTKVMEV